MSWERLSDAVDSGTVRMHQDNVLVRVDLDQGDVRPDALIRVPLTAKREKQLGLLGTVLAVGPGYHPEIKTKPDRKQNRGYWETSPTVGGPFIATVVKPGDRVVLESQLAGDIWPLRQGEHRLVRESEILAVLEP